MQAAFGKLSSKWLGESQLFFSVIVTITVPSLFSMFQHKRNFIKNRTRLTHKEVLFEFSATI